MISTSRYLISHLNIRKVFTTSTKSITNSPHYIAIIGSGPSGFYCAKYLLEYNDNNNIHIDIYEKLPTPFGLVRYGVAPDHQSVKHVIKDFKQIIEKHKDRIRYFGNVHVGNILCDHNHTRVLNNITLNELRRIYSSVILAYGASRDSNLNIENENLHGILSSREFVYWYNGHPDYIDLNKIMKLEQVKDIVIIGNGNVAIDCARVLLKSSTSDSSHSLGDIAKYAWDTLNKCNLETITIIGRRGHVQASFTIKEFRELTKLNDVRLNIDNGELTLGLTQASEEEIESSEPKSRIVKLIHSVASQTSVDISRNISRNSDETTAKSKKLLNLRFLLSPKRFTSNHIAVNQEPHPVDDNRVNGVIFERNTLHGTAGNQSVQGSGTFVTLPCQLVLKSVGFKCVNIDTELPWDKKTSTVPHLDGRVLKQTNINEVDSTTANNDDNGCSYSSDDDLIERGLYVTGWLKRGPVGIIASNINDARETVSSVLEDIDNGVITIPDLATSRVNGTTTRPMNDPVYYIPLLMKHVESDENSTVISWDEYMKLDDEEMRLGKIKHDANNWNDGDKVSREKITNIDDMIAICKR